MPLAYPFSMESWLAQLSLRLRPVIISWFDRLCNFVYLPDLGCWSLLETCAENGPAAYLGTRLTESLYDDEKVAFRNKGLSAGADAEMIATLTSI